MVDVKNVNKLENVYGLPPQTSYTCTHAVTPMQLQITPCTAQVAGHTSDKSHPAQLRGCSATILAAIEFQIEALNLIQNIMENKN